MTPTPPLQTEILRYFPAQVHPLSLVHDPDELLLDEALLAELYGRGFQLINEADGLRLRQAWYQHQPLQVVSPLIISTTAPLNQLPYDIWQQGHPIELALHHFFPTLAYPVVRELSAYQRSRLSQTSLPRTEQGQQASLRFILHHVFKFNLTNVAEAAELIAWLGQYHQQGERLPPLAEAYLLQTLQQVPPYRTWPLADLLQRAEALRQFLQEAWAATLPAGPMAEKNGPYQLNFQTNSALQQLFPHLIHQGWLRPRHIADSSTWPAWATAGLLQPSESEAEHRLADVSASLDHALTELPSPPRWENWEHVAFLWAEYVAGYHSLPQGPSTDLKANYARLAQQLDARFLSWLKTRYSPLAVNKLPTPHHLYHLPTYLADYRRKHPAPVALLILDGLSLGVWHRIRQQWQKRHPAWQWQEGCLLAQVPSITAISRQALVSGLPPRQFAKTLSHNQAEAKLWQAHWQNAGLPPARTAYLRFSPQQNTRLPELDAPGLEAVCLVSNAIDDMVHGASLGLNDVYASLTVWLNQHSAALENLIDQLLQRGFHLFISSDHGHVEAEGVGYPNDSILVKTRSQRARLYQAEISAITAQNSFTDTLIWAEDGLLPPETWCLIPTQRHAFALVGETVVTHGGLSVDEMLVPLVQISSP